MLGASTALAGLVALDAAAGPQDGQVVAGQATIQQAGGGRTNIIQSTDRAVIDWRGFSIGAGEHVDFQQPGAGSVTLNRVTGSQSSLIDGRLTATGNVFIVNPNGVIFGKGASVDVGGLVATTTNLSNANFMAGRYLFDQPSGVAGAAVVNEGSISVREGGLAALVAPTVRNSGIITARLGRVVLAGAETATVDLYGDGLLAFDTGVSTAVTHDGAINANGGSVLLTTAQAKGVVDGAINMGGTITARSVEKQGGKIILKGAGSVAVAGTLDASGKDAGASGGEVKVLGDTVALHGSARIDVSGDQGGGSALIGGNIQGQGTEQRAADTLVAGGALITADAISAGKGGTVVVWADNHTQFDGTISARGGTQGGDGGFVETSGKRTLGIKTGKVDASAPKGKGGQWLLDPRNVEIANATTKGGLTDGTYTPTDDDATVAASAIQTALNAGTNVTVTTTDASGGQAGNITTSADVTWTSSATLTLIAEGSITLSNTFAGTAGTLDLRAAGSISQSGGTISVATLLASAGSSGSITLDKANQIDTLGAFSAGGSFTLTDTTGGLTVSGVTIATGGAVSITTAGGALTLQGDLTANTISLSSSGAITQSAGTINTGTLSAFAGSSIQIDKSNTIGSLGSLVAGSAITLNDSAGGLSLNGTVSGSAVAISTAGGTLDVQATVSAAAVQLTGSGVSIASSVTVDAGSGGIILDGGAGTLTLGTGTLVLSTGSITLRADSMAIASAAQVGGTAAGTDSAGTVTVTGSTAGRSIGVAGGSGGLALSADELASIRATHGVIGSNTSGAITFGAWTPAATFASGQLTVTGNAGASFAGAVSLAGNLVINPGGAITQSAALTVAGNTTVNAAGFDVTLDNAGNDFQGTFGGSAAALTLKGGAISFATLSAASLSVTTTGDITQAGDITVTGDTSVSAGGNAVTLDRSGNDFQGSFGGSMGALTLKGGAIEFAVLSAASVSVTTTGAITQSGNLTVSGTAGFDAGSNDITLNRGGNDFQDAVSVTGGTVSVTDTNALTIGGSTGALTLGSDALTLTTLSAASLDITAGGAITQTDDLTISGSTTIGAGNSAVTLDRGGNDFQAAVSITGGAVSVTDQNGLTFGGSTGALSIASAALAFNTTSASSLSVTASGNITQNADISVSGTTTLAAGGNAITLSRGGNNFSGTVAATGGAVSIGDTNALTLGTVSAASLTVAAAGSVTQGSGSSLTITGATSVDAGSSAVTLTENGNNFTGTVAVIGGAVSLTDGNAISLAGTSATSLTVQAGGTIAQASATSIAATGAVSFATTTGNIVFRVLSAASLEATTTGSGSITQAAGALTIAGATTLATGSGGISVANGNNFGSTVAASTTGNVSIRDAADLTVADISGNNVTLRSSGTLTQAAGTAIDANGTSSLIAGAGAITLANAGNGFAGSVTVSTSGAVSLRDADALTVSVTGTAGTLTLRAADALSLTGSAGLTLGDIDATGFTVNAAGAVTQAAGTSIDVSGTTSVATTSGAITLDSAANSFGGELSLSGAGSDATVAASGGITFGTVAVASLNVTATGGLAQGSGCITVTGATTLDAGAITLLTAGNNFGGIVTVTGNAVSLADAGALTLGDVSASSLTISANGALAQAAATALQITGISTLGASSVTLDNAGNSFGNTVSIAGSGAVTLAADGDLKLGPVTASSLTAAAGDELRLTGSSAIGGAVALTGTSFVLSAGSSLAAGSGTITVTADSMTLSGSIATTGAVTLRTRDTARDIRLGSTAAGSLSLTDNDLDTLSGASGLTIGRADGTGTITIGGALDLTGDAGNLTLSGGAIVLGQSISTSGSITFGAATTLAGSSPVTLTSTAGNVALASGVEGTSDGAQTLVIKAGGTVTLGATGAGVRLASLDVSGATITMAAGTATTGAQSYTGTMVLSGDSSFSTDNADFTVTGGIRGSGAGGQDLSIAIGSGTLDVGTIGSGTAVGTFSASASALDLASITATGDITLTANSGGVSVGTLSHGSGNVLIIADSIALTGNWSGSGTRTIQPRSISRGLTIGASGSDFELTATELAFLGNGSPSAITIGRADGTGTISINSFSFDDSLTIQGGNTTLQPGAITWANASILTLKANGNLELYGAITGVNGALVLTATGNVSQETSLAFVPPFFFTFVASPIVVDSLSVAAGGNISMDRPFSAASGANAVAGRVDLSAGGSIAYSGSGALTLGTISAASLAISGVSSIGQSAGATVTVTGTSTFGASGAITLTEASNDFGGAVAVSTAGAVTLRDGNALVLGTLSAASLDLTADGALTQTGDVIVTGTTRVTSSTAAITLNRAGNNFGGAVTIVDGGATTLADQTDLLLGNINATSLVATAQGTLGQAASTTLGIAGATALTAGGITLTNAGNDFQGAVSISSSGTVALRDTNALILGTASAGSLSITVAGALTQTGDITVTGTTTIAAGGNAVTLDRNGSNFQGAVTVTGGAVILTDGNALVLGSVDATSLVLTAPGGITQTGDITVSGTTTIAAGSGGVTLGGGNNDFQGAVAVTGGAVTLTDKNALILGSINAVTLGVTVSGAITQTGDVAVGGDTTIVAGSNAVTLGNAGNDFGGTLTLTGGAVMLRDANSLALATLSAASLDLTVGGALTQAGDVTVTGTTKLTSSTAAITLDRSGNNFGGAVSIVTGGDTTLTDQNDLLLGSVGASSLTVTAQGALTQVASTAIGVTGTTALTAAGIALANSGNDFTGAVSASSGGGVSLRDSNALILGTVTAASLSITAAGALTQVGDVTVTGSTTISAGSNAVTLNRTGNDFQGAVAVTGGAVSLVDKDALVLGTTSAASLALATAGDITQTGDLTITGTTSITAGSSAVTLDRSGNNFTGAVSVAGGTVSLRDANALAFGTVTTASLSVTTGGAVTQTGAMVVSGTTTINAGSSAVTLGNSGNDFGDVTTITTSGAVTLRDSNALVLGPLSVASLDVTVGGVLTQTGDIIVAGTTKITGSAAAITLDRAGNNFGGVVGIVNAGDTVLSDQNALLLGNVGANSLTVTAQGSLSQSGSTVLSITGTTALTAAGIALANSGNDFQGAVSASSSSAVNLRDANALILGTVGAASLNLTAAGALTQTGDITVTGNSTISAASNTVALDRGNNDFQGTVSVAGGAVTLADRDALILGTTSATSLTLTAVGALTQVTGTAINTGATNLSADSIALASAGNNFTGAVSASSAGAVSLRDSNALILAAVTAASLNVTTGGALTQTGDITVSGTTTITAGANTVTLGRSGNDFQGEVAVVGGAVTLADKDAIVLAATTAASLSVTTSGAITQTGKLGITGGLTLDAGTGTVVLADAANSYGTLSILSAGSAVLADAAALAFGTVVVAGDLTATAGGAVTQTGDVLVGGTANFTVIAGADITLYRDGNDFGTFSAANARDISVQDKNAVALGPVTATGTVKVKTGGTLTQSAALVAAALRGESGGDAILDRADNVIATLGPFTSSGRLAVASSAGTFVVSSTAAGAGGVSLIAAAAGGTLSVQSTAVIGAGNSDVLLQGDDIQLAAAIGGPGLMTLQSTTASRNVTVGATVAGELSLTQAEINLLGDGHSRINIGREDGSGRIDIRTITFLDPVSFRSPATGGSVKLNGTLVGQGNASFEFLGSGATTTLNGSIITDGQDIVFNDAVVLASTLALSTQTGRLALPTAVLDTTGGGRVATGGDVVFMKGFNATTAFVEGIDIYAGTQGKVVFEEDIGAKTAVGRLRVFSGASFTADVDMVMTRILDIDVSGLALARNVTATEELLIRGVGGTADLTLSSVRGNGDAFAAFFVRRPDGVADGYLINGCIMATTCGMDMVFLGVSLPPYRDDPDVGTRGVSGSIGSPAMRSPRLLSASVQSPNDDFSIQYSSPADRELW